MDFTSTLARLKEGDRFRQRKEVSPGPGSNIKVNGRSLINFSSNDYLGLANDARIIKAFKQAADKYGVGGGASQYVSGYCRPARELEERVADYLGRQAGMWFANGYMANLGIQQALSVKGSQIYMDRLVHASIIDAAMISRTNINRYAHADVSALEALLESKSPDNDFIITDAVFSMDGDIAPLEQINALALTKNIPWIVDDAHGFGVLGKSGKGSLEYLGLSQESPLLQLVTCGKALGCYGAMVVGDAETIEMLIQKSRSAIYTTALPPSLAAASLKALDICQAENHRREKLDKLISLFRSAAKKENISLLESITPIQAVVVGDEKQTLKISQRLQEKGFLVVAIRPPTVPENTSRLRITLSANHTEENVLALVNALAICFQEPV